MSNNDVPVNIILFNDILKAVDKIDYHILWNQVMGYGLDSTFLNTLSHYVEIDEMW